MFNSDAKQDEFVANILRFQENGFYLDIGSHDYKKANNSYYFSEHLNWTGICVEMAAGHQEGYKSRKNCIFLNENVLQMDLKKVLTQNNFPVIIDYVSIDIDTLSLQILRQFPFDQFIPKTLTIEHDGYIYGDLYRLPQRNLLISHDYHLVCSNVHVEQEGYGSDLPFEDWWIKKGLFDMDEIEKIQSDDSLPSEIINKFRTDVVL